MSDLAAYLKTEILKAVAEDNLEVLFSMLVKKDLALAIKFADNLKRVSSDELSRRHRLTDAMHLHIVKDFPIASAHIARDIQTSTRKLATAVKPCDVLAVIKEIADQILRYLTFGGAVVETGNLPAEFKVLIDMGAHCADFLSEDQRRDITQSISDYVNTLMQLNF
jgi:hypothetical protein